MPGSVRPNTKGLSAVQVRFFLVGLFFNMTRLTISLFFKLSGVSALKTLSSEGSPNNSLTSA